MFTAEWIWLYVGALLMLAEIVSPGFVIFFFGLSAVTVAGLKWLIPSLSLSAQLAAFSVLSIVYLLGLRRYVKSIFDGDKNGESELQDETIGKLVTVTEEIKPDDPGRVMLGDAEWKAEAARVMAVGEKAHVKARNNLTLIVESLALMLSFVALAEKPTVVWASYPVKSGEHVMLHGGAWSKNAKVRFGGRVIKPVLVTDTGIVFEWPRDVATTMLGGRVEDENGESNDFILNAPDVWWMQGDDGMTSHPGGWLCIFGRGLEGGEVRMISVADGKEYKSKTILRRDGYRLSFMTSGDWPLGKYTVQVRTQYCKNWRDVGEWEIAPKVEFWKDNLFDVTQFGAVPNDGIDDSSAIDKALAAAAQNGGGIVYLPRGRFQYNGTLVIPTNTLLRGVSRELSSLYWPDTMNPPQNLIEGSHSFGIHDLFIHSGQYRNGIVAVNELSKMHSMANSRTMYTHDVSLKRLTLRFISDQWRDMNGFSEYVPRYTMPGNGVMVRSCRRGIMEDVDLYCDKKADSTLYFIFTGEYIRMNDCRIGGSGWAVIGGDRVMFERNECWNCTYSIANVTRRFWHADNIQHALYNNNREAVTHDGAKVAFFNGLVGGKVNGVNVELKYPDTIKYRGGANEWVGYDLQICAGRGVGQTRSIVALPDFQHVTIDKPFDILPDETSRFVICAERRHLIYYNNQMEDAATGIQLYGGASECIIARNTNVRSSGCQGSGRDYNGIIPCWFVQFFDNTIAMGNGYRGPQNERLPGDAEMGAFWSSGNLPLSQSYVVRNNFIRSNGRINLSVYNGIVEGNTIQDSDYGITSRIWQNTLFIGDNRFSNVITPFFNLDGAVFSEGALRLRNENAATFIKQLENPSMSSYQVNRILGLHCEFQPWNMQFRRACRLEHKTRFQVPFTLELGNDCIGAEQIFVSIPDDSKTGWRFGGRIELKREANSLTKWSTIFNITPPHEGYSGFFSLPVNITIIGKQQTVKTVMEVQPLVENRLLGWNIALVDGNKLPSANAKLEWKRATKLDRHEVVHFAQEYGAALKGKSVVAQRKLKVNERTRFLFSRADGFSELYINDRLVIGQNISVGAKCVEVLEPGEYTLRFFQPAEPKLSRGSMPRTLRVVINHSSPVPIGAYTFIE